MKTKYNIELFRIETEEYEEFEGKSLDMLRCLMKDCDAVEMHKDCEGVINIVGLKNKKEE